MAHAEASSAHQREMEHLSKRSQVQRIELGKAQVLERLNLEAMLKGWYSLHKVRHRPFSLQICTAGRLFDARSCCALACARWG